MGVCKANVGNLMQHWTLAESLAELQRHVPEKSHLHFVTSHSMAPWSIPPEVPQASSSETRAQFDRARVKVASRISNYERTWAKLSGRGGLPYPSSALFSRELWAGPLSLTLCEADSGVADEIAGWAAVPENVAATHTEIHRGDWRDRFRHGFEASGVLVIEMDPMRFEHHDPPQGRDNRAVLFPEDLQLVVAATAKLDVPVVLQISSFSANNDNPHQVVAAAITAALSVGGFALQGRVEANGNMISLVYSRGLQLWAAPAAPLGQRFTQWLSTI